MTEERIAKKIFSLILQIIIIAYMLPSAGRRVVLITK